MKRLLPTGLPGSLAITVLVVAISGSALGYFSGSGGGSASAAVSKLNTPTISAATAAAGGTVSLSWGAVTPPGAGAVTYSVTRDGGQPAGSCPTAAAPTTVVTCVDSGLSIGEHSYTVMARWETWTATSSTKTANVTIGAVAKFVIAGSTTTPAVGSGVNLTITAKDINNSTVTTYTGSHSLVFSGASSSPSGSAPSVVNSANSAIAFGSATALTFTAGVATAASSKNGFLKIYKAGAANVVAAEGSITTPAPLALIVSPGAATKYVVAAATTTPAAGAADNLTITAQDSYGNTATAYTGSHSLVFSTAAASPAGNAPTVTNSSGADIAFGSATAIEFNEGVSDAAEGDGGVMKLYKSGSVSLKGTEGSITNTALAITVAAGSATKLALTAATTTTVAAANDNLTTTAQDVYGNAATTYTGAKNITFSGASASPSGALPTVVNSAGSAINFGSATALTFSSGVATVASSKNGVMKLNKAGETSVSATDGSISTATPLTVVVSVGTAARLGLTGVTVSAGAIGAPCLFTCAITSLGNSGTVTAAVSVTDSVGNLASGVGTGHTVAVTANGGTITGGSLTIADTGPAVSATQFTYTAPVSGAFSNTITATAKAGSPLYTAATATAGK